MIDAESIFAVPSCRLLVSGGHAAKIHASRPVLAEHVFASHFRIDAKAICGVEIVVCAGVAKAQQQFMITSLTSLPPFLGIFTLVLLPMPLMEKPI